MTGANMRENTYFSGSASILSFFFTIISFNCFLQILQSSLFYIYLDFLDHILLRVFCLREVGFLKSFRSKKIRKTTLLLFSQIWRNKSRIILHILFIRLHELFYFISYILSFTSSLIYSLSLSLIIFSNV